MQAQSLPPTSPAEGSKQPQQRTSVLPVAALGLVLVLGGCGGLSAFQSDSESLLDEPAAAALPLPPNAVELTQKAIDEGRTDDAKKMLERVLRAEPQNAEARLLLGELFLVEGQWSQAYGVFDQMTGDVAAGARAQQGAGIAAMRDGKQLLAVDHLKKAVESDPQLWRAWNALGTYYDSKEQWSEADEAYDMAIAAAPDEAMLYNNLGFSQFNQGRLEESIASLERALALDPELEPAKANLRLALAWSGRYVHAISGTEDRDLPRVLNNVGYIALMRGDLDNAEAYLLRAMEADPSFNEVAWRNLAYLRNVRELKAAEAAEAAEQSGALPE